MFERKSGKAFYFGEQVPCDCLYFFGHKPIFGDGNSQEMPNFSVY
jgi:hypothetical protein